MQALKWIEKVESTKNAAFLNIGSAKLDFPIDLHKSQKSFQFKIDFEKIVAPEHKFHLGKFNDSIQLKIDDQLYLASRVFVNQRSLSTVCGTIEQIRSKEYSTEEEYYYQVYIPLDSDLNFHYTLEEMKFESDLGIRSRTGTKCRIGGDDIVVSIIRDDREKQFLVLESKCPQDFDSFSKKAFAARNALAFLTGFYAGDSCYFFGYEDDRMEHPKYLYLVSIRDSMKSVYEPVNVNPFSRLYHNKPVAEEWYKSKKLRRVSIDEFSRLGDLIFNDRKFEAAIILILESSVSSLLFRPAGYAIALETIAPLIFQNDLKTIVPITNNEDWGRIRKRLIAELNQLKVGYADYDFGILENKINNLNTASNNSKLRAPFEFLKTDLLDEDLRILKTRNYFLHGNAPDITNSGKDRSIDRYNKDLHYVALRFYTLLSMLILKWVGFDNYVLNYPWIMQKSTGIELNDESPYRKLVG